MERFFYSASRLGFFTESMHGALTRLAPDPDWAPSEESETIPPMVEVIVRESMIPADAVELSADEYRMLIDGQAQCQEIVPGPDGRPILVPPPAPTPEQLAGRAGAERDRLLSEAAIRIAPLQDAVDIGEATAADEAALLAWKQYRVKLNRISQQEGYPSTIEWPQKPG